MKPLKAVKENWIFILGLIVMFCIIASAAQAQSLDGKIAVVGPYYSADVPGSVGGFAVMAIPIAQEGKLKSFTGFKMFAARATEPADIVLVGHRLRYKVFTGFSRELIGFGKLSFHAIGTGGFETDGVENGFTADLGGFAFYPISGRFGILLIGAAEYSSIENAWIVNPAGGLSIKF